jgi:hypothetical protein
MTQTVVPETPAVARRVEAPSATVDTHTPLAQEADRHRVSLLKRLSRTLDFHPAVGVADIMFPDPTRDRRRR